MYICRVRESEKKYLKYEESYIRNTAFIAFEGEVIESIFEYKIITQNKAEIINFLVMKKEHEKALFKDFMKELSYWHPYIREVSYNGQVIEMQSFADIFKISLDKIIPAQLTVNEEKLARVLSWIDKPQDVIISCLKIEDKVICIDGHTRLVAAYKKGFPYIYGYYEEVEDKEFYETCLKWCEKEAVKHVSHLLERVETPDEHEKLWIDKCQQYFKRKK